MSSIQLSQLTQSLNIILVRHQLRVLETFLPKGSKHLLVLELARQRWIQQIFISYVLLDLLVRFGC